MAKETAEQKLLKLIEAQEKGATAATAAGTAAVPVSNVAQQIANSVKGPELTITSLPGLNTIFSFFKGGTSKPQIAFTLREINFVIMAIVGIVLIFFIFDFKKGINYASRGFHLSVESKIAKLPENLLPQLKEISDYVSVVARRNIFQPFEKKQEEQVAATPVDIQHIMEKTKDLRLVGISWLSSSDSASALIENTNSGTTYFLRTGDQINKVTVKKIFADSVILTFEGEDLKLSL